MARIVLICLLSLAFAGKPFLQAGTYGPFKEFVQGFMDGYSGKDYELGDYCLDSTTEEKLNEDFVAVFSYLIRGKIEDTFTQLGVVVGDIDAVFNDCGLYKIVESLNYDISTNGIIHMIMNVLWHAFDFSANVLDVIEELVTANWESAGNKLGDAIADIIEPKPDIFLPMNIVKEIARLMTSRPIL